MNRKGFTLIELLGVVVLLGIILTFAVPSLVNVYKDSKLKMEDVFLKELSKGIDSYITLNNGNIDFESSFKAVKKEEDKIVDTVDVMKGTIDVHDLIEDMIISEDDYVNPGNKDVKCNNAAVVEVYKDSNFVYCYKVSKYVVNEKNENVQNLGCLTDKYIESVSGEYVIDSCVWEVKITKEEETK